MCHPGKPFLPPGNGASHCIRCLSSVFQRAKSRGSPLLLVDRHPRPLLQLIEPLAGQLAVLRKPADVEVDVAVHLIRDSPIQQVGDDLAHLGDVVGCPGQLVGRPHAQLVHAGHKTRRCTSGRWPRGPAAPCGRRPASCPRRLHIVLRQVADIGDVHHLGDLEAAILQEPPQQIRQQEAAEVADVGRGVDRRSAGVQPDLARNERREVFEAAG